MIKHMIHQPFVFATGLAALVHSTWALGTLFAGNEPEQFTFAWFSWVIPAFLIAFALDVGQIVTSSEIRAGKRNSKKYLTFFVFAVATYYLQWTYMVHHMPDLALSAGIRETWGDLVTLIRDCAIWIIPALLPLSTLLYTLSADEMPIPAQQPTEKPSAPVTVETPAIAQIAEPKPALVQTEKEETTPENFAQLTDLLQESHVFTCEDCGWSKEYEDLEAGERGLRTHKARHCTAQVVTQNGHHS